MIRVLKVQVNSKEKVSRLIGSKKVPARINPGALFNPATGISIGISLFKSNPAVPVIVRSKGL